MSKKTDCKIIVLIVAAVALVGYFSGPFSTLVPQEREIGRLAGQGSGDYLCPTSYNGMQVDRCQGFRYRVGFELWEQSYFKGYVFSRALCQEYKTQGYRGEYTCREAITCATPSGASCYSMGQYGVYSDGTFPLGFGAGDTASFQGSGDIIYYENFIQCPDNSYNYRSLCPKENSQMPVTVRDLKTDATISGASVSISGKSVKPGQTTDNNGVVVFFVYPGTYIITASKDGYKTGILQYSAVEPAPNIPFNSAAIRLEKSTSATPINNTPPITNPPTVQPPVKTGNWLADLWNGFVAWLSNAFSGIRFY